MMIGFFGNHADFYTESHCPDKVVKCENSYETLLPINRNHLPSGQLPGFLFNSNISQLFHRESLRLL